MFKEALDEAASTGVGWAMAMTRRRQEVMDKKEVTKPRRWRSLPLIRWAVVAVASYDNFLSLGLSLPLYLLGDTGVAFFCGTVRSVPVLWCVSCLFVRW